MLTEIHPKLPMRNKLITREFYCNKLGFTDIGSTDYDGYLLVRKDAVEIHFFIYEDLNPNQNYGQVYIRTSDINGLYAEFIAMQVAIHPASPLQTKPWGQKEFALLDPDNNLLTFGEAV